VRKTLSLKKAPVKLESESTQPILAKHDAAIEFLETSPPWRDGELLCVGYRYQVFAVIPKGIRKDYINMLLKSRATQRWYLELIEEGRPRYNFEGEEQGLVTWQEEEAAKKTLAKSEKFRKDV